MCTTQGPTSVAEQSFNQIATHTLAAVTGSGRGAVTAEALAQEGEGRGGSKGEEADGTLSLTGVLQPRKSFLTLSEEPVSHRNRRACCS